MVDRSSPGTPVSAVLIGCGNIGSRFDEGLRGGGLTHASALTGAGAQLVAVCDLDATRARECALHRQVEHVFSDPFEMMAATKPDLVCIATPPGGNRYDIVAAAIDAGVKGIFCEKPLAASLEEAERLRALVLDADVQFAVNHLRSWSPGLDHALAATRAWSCVDRIVVHYDKGIANNGSHAVDLIRHFVGWPGDFHVLSVVDDGRTDDPTVELHCEFRGGARATFLAGDYRAYSRFEVELCSNDGRVAFLDKGRVVVVDELVEDSEYAEYRVLSQTARLEHGLKNAMVRALASVVDAIRGRPSEVRCTIDDAVHTMRFVERVRQTVRKR